MDTDAKYRLGYPAYRVFIFGVEVSDYVQSINTSSHDGASPNQCQISLLNEFDKFVITTNDMLYINNNVGSQLKLPWLQNSTSPGYTNSSFSSDKVKDPGVFSRIKKLLLTRKGAITQQVDASQLDDATGQPVESTTIFANYFGPEIKKYPLADGCPIFHAMDPVRVFFRDPYNPSKWYHMFSGFVSDIVDTTGTNNDKYLNIVAEDPTKLFRHTRVFINPGVTDASQVIFDGDLALQSFWTQKFHDYTLSEVMFTLLFGSDFSRGQIDQPADGPQNTSPMRTRLRAIGHFAGDLSFVATLGSPPPQSSQADQGEQSDPATVGQMSIAAGPGTQHDVPIFHLQDRLDVWQLFLDHIVQPSDMHTMATENDRFIGNTQTRKAQVSSIDSSGNSFVDITKVIGFIGRNPDLYPVDGGRLMILIPHSMGTRNNNVLMKDLITSYPLQSDSVTVGQIISDVMTRLEFSMYCSPRGDIVVEMPLYDFDPDMFGSVQISKDEVSSLISDLGPAAANDILIDGINIFGSVDRDPFMSNYVVLRSDTTAWSNAHIDEKVFTVAVAKEAILKNWDNGPFSDIYGGLSVVKRDALIPLYGYRQLPLTPRGYIATPDGASLYANICLNRMNAEAHSYNVTFNPNFNMWVNRPIYIQGRNTIATTKSITHNITWGQAGDLTTSCDMYASRTWKGDFSKTDPTRPIFTSINGYGTSLLNYAVLFGYAPLPTSVDSPINSVNKSSDATPDALAGIIDTNLITGSGN